MESAQHLTESMYDLNMTVLQYLHFQCASQVGALDIGYKPGLPSKALKDFNILYLLGAVSNLLILSYTTIIA